MQVYPDLVRRVFATTPQEIEDFEVVQPGLDRLEIWFSVSRGSSMEDAEASVRRLFVELFDRSLVIAPQLHLSGERPGAGLTRKRRRVDRRFPMPGEHS